MENKIITLPSGIVVELKPYAEAGIFLDIGKHKDDQNKFLIESLVVKLDGSDKDIWKRARVLRISDYKAIDTELGKLIQDDLGNLNADTPTTSTVSEAPQP
jgi:hypothetical protein